MPEKHEKSNEESLARLFANGLKAGINAMGISEACAKMRRGRQEFAEKYCRDNAWSLPDLTFEQIFEIRSQPGWKSPD